MSAAPVHRLEARSDATTALVQVHGTRIQITDLVLTDREAAGLLSAEGERHGDAAVVDLVARALPVGLVAVTMGSASVDTGSLTRTLDGFAERVDARSNAALARLEDTLGRLRTGEEQVTEAARTARAVLENLPAQVEAKVTATLAGEAGDVRAAVAEATRTVQAAGLAELTTALAAHSRSVEQALTLDRESPIRTLRHDVLTELNGVRRELTEQLATVRGLVEAATAAKTAAAKSTRAVGTAWEDQALALADEVVSSAGDRFENTSGQPGRGTTRRTGDAVATLTSAITGPAQVRIVLEAKHRSKPLTVKQLRDEIRTACTVREAAGGLILVPTAGEIPGGGLFARVDERGYVVAADDPAVVRLVYLVLREVIAVAILRHSPDQQVDLAAVETRLATALIALNDFDEVARLAHQASRNLDKLREVGARCQATIRAALTETLEHLHA